MQTQKNYYRITAGAKSVHLEQCFKDGFIGCDWGAYISSDVMVGQTQRYMGYVKDELAESNQIKQ
jgi:hypothetical protein